MTRPIAKREAPPAPLREHQRNHAEHHGRGRHEDRPQAHAGGGDDGVALGFAALLLLVGDLDDQDAVLADESDQRDEAHLGVDVERGAVRRRAR